MKKIKTVNFRLLKGLKPDIYGGGPVFHIQIKGWFGWKDHYVYSGEGETYGREIVSFDSEEEAIKELDNIFWYKQTSELNYIQHPTLEIIVKKLKKS